MVVAVAAVATVTLGVPWLALTAGSAGRTDSVEEYADSGQRADVALVLGAQVNPDGRPSRYLKGRLDTAAELYRRGLVKVLLVSGDNGEEHYNEPEGMKRYLVEAGIPPAAVVMDFAGFDTYDSCVRAKKIFGVDRLVVISQGYHLPRAVTTCRLVGVDAHGVGDWSVQATGRFQNVPVLWRLGWTRFAVRELPASYKMLWDVGSRRTPTLGDPEPGVRDAVAGR
ncbi:SanA/YdcF family protein [Luteococcus sp. H138]|uniref:SanA/YdcF family protein n=1 Tax=unclassified Luteococcus TaxID=2639923 RepID=UPI00406D3DBD